MAAVIISGSRRIRNYELVAGIIESAIARFGFKPSLIIEGGQRTWQENKKDIIGGVDYFAKLWALRNSIPLKTVRANWQTQGRAAGPIRNREMAMLADYLIAIPTKDSKGTLDMIRAMRKRALPEENLYIVQVFEDSDKGNE